MVRISGGIAANRNKAKLTCATSA